MLCRTFQRIAITHSPHKSFNWLHSFVSNSRGILNIKYYVRSADRAINFVLAACSSRFPLAFVFKVFTAFIIWTLDAGFKHIIYPTAPPLRPQSRRKSGFSPSIYSAQAASCELAPPYRQRCLLVSASAVLSAKGRWP